MRDMTGVASRAFMAAQQTSLEKGRKGEAPTTYPHPIHDNVLPHIDVFQEDGYTKEERKMIDETQKILSQPDLAVTATCVRVPESPGTDAGHQNFILYSGNDDNMHDFKGPEKSSSHRLRHNEQNHSKTCRRRGT